MRHLIRRLQALVVGMAVMQRPGRAPAEQLQVDAAVEHGAEEAPLAEGGAEVARLVELLVDPGALELLRESAQHGRRLAPLPIRARQRLEGGLGGQQDRKSTRLNSSP